MLRRLGEKSPKREPDEGRKDHEETASDPGRVDINGAEGKATWSPGTGSLNKEKRASQKRTQSTSPKIVIAKKQSL